VQSDLLFAFQAAVVIIMSKFTGRLFERRLRQPAVVGEVAAGILIGPFALGGIPLPVLGPLFPLAPGGVFEPGLLGALTITGAVVLMFDAGLETNLRKFLAYAPAGLAAGLGGAVLSFALGAYSMIWLGLARSLSDPVALVMGAIATATSVGLTVRVLSDMRRLNSPEGSTILSAAVIDDVIGLVFLSLVIAVSSGTETGTGLWSRAGIVSLRAVLVFCGLLGAGLLFRKRLVRLLAKLGSVEAAGAAALAMGLFAAGLAEASGLALIVGAYVMGLSLSETDIVHVLHNALQPVRELLVPVLFCVTGMNADLSGAGSVLVAGLVYTLLTGVGKIVGCGLPGLLFGFGPRGCLRIGVGMLPRQEVGLIAAGIALSRGLIQPAEMGIVIVMVLLTAMTTPPLLKSLFRGGPGIVRGRIPSEAAQMRLSLPLPAPALVDAIAEQSVALFRAEGFYVFRLPVSGKAWDIRKDDVVISMEVATGRLDMTASCESMEYARLVLAEALNDLKQVLSEFEQVGDASILRRLYGVESCPGEDPAED
jgi:Kef-type K+ transport system membrane component KefB